MGRVLLAVLCGVVTSCSAPTARADAGTPEPLGGGGATGGGLGAGGGDTGGGDGSGGGSDGGGATIDAGTPDAGDPCAIADGTTFAPHLSVLRDGSVAEPPFFVSERLEFQVSGLPPCQPVDLSFSLDGGHHTSARFRASPGGTLSTRFDAPLSGGWTTADVDAPFWTMSGGTPLTPSNFDTLVGLQWDGGATSTLVPRALLPAGTLVTEFREATLEGLYANFYRPPGPGPFPAVVVWGGSDGALAGGLLSGSSFVHEGFAVLVIAYWAVPGKPGGMSRIPLEIFERGLQRVRALPGVKTDKVGIVGLSRGGEAALLVGAAFPTEVQAVVSIVGSGYGLAAPSSSTASTWTLDGGDVPFIAWPTGDGVTVARDAGYVVSFSAPFFDQGVSDAEDAGLLEQAQTPVERIRGPVLLWSSGDDGIWPSCRLSTAAWHRLVDAGHAAQWGDEATCFLTTGHSINPSRPGQPLVDTIDRGTGPSRTGYGGSAKADNDADRIVHDETVRFLHQALE